MNEVKNRVPTRPGRVKITFEDGTVQYVTMERADEPAEVGTAIDKVLFDSINKDLAELKNATNKKTIFNSDGSITETTENITLKTTFNSDGSIIEVITSTNSSYGNITRKTVFNSDGSITQTIS